MSIKGIDTQMMIARTADAVKDSSTQLKKNELMQDYLAVQTKAMEQHDKSKVTGTVETQEVEIKTDKDSQGSAQAYDDNQYSKKREQGQQPDPLDQMVPPDDTTIDIKI